jgi:hypothetical protein
VALVGSAWSRRMGHYDSCYEYDREQAAAEKQRKADAMKRAAKHVVIQFSVGTERGRFRMRVGGDIERSSEDELGQTIWIKIRGEEPRGLPSKAAVLERALTKVFGELPPFDDNRYYPLGVVCMEAVPGDEPSSIFIDVGNFSS